MSKRQQPQPDDGTEEQGEAPPPTEPAATEPELVAVTYKAAATRIIAGRAYRRGATVTLTHDQAAEALALGLVEVAL